MLTGFSKEIYININPWNARPILLHNLDAFASLFSLHANYMGIARPDRNARETGQGALHDYAVLELVD